MNAKQWYQRSTWGHLFFTLSLWSPLPLHNLSFFELSIASMASLSAASSLSLSSSLRPSFKNPNQITGKSSSPKIVAVGWGRNGFQSLRTSRLRISCAAKPETVEKVCEVVRKQLALAADIDLTPSSKFSDLGADSLDTVEIVMGLEEEFNINVEEDNSQNITTVQEAADLIDKLVAQKSAA